MIAATRVVLPSEGDPDAARACLPSSLVEMSQSGHSLEADPVHRRRCSIDEDVGQLHGRGNSSGRPGSTFRSIDGSGHLPSMEVARVTPFPIVKEPRSGLSRTPSSWAVSSAKPARRSGNPTWLSRPQSTRGCSWRSKRATRRRGRQGHARSRVSLAGAWNKLPALVAEAYAAPQSRAVRLGLPWLIALREVTISIRAWRTGTRPPWKRIQADEAQPFSWAPAFAA
jgi:hypothetical protein